MDNDEYSRVKRSYNKITRKFHEPWTNLAYAIIVSAVQDYDITFLSSSWKEELEEMIALDIAMYDHDGVTNYYTKGRTHNGAD